MVFKFGERMLRLVGSVDGEEKKVRGRASSEPLAVGPAQQSEAHGREGAAKGPLWVRWGHRLRPAVSWKQ